MKKRHAGKFTFGLIAAAFLLASCAPATPITSSPPPTDTSAVSASGSYMPGTYYGTGNGQNGEVKVEVTTNADKIVSVNVIESKETPSISDTPIREIPEQIVAGQTLMVDTVSGATNTSRAILEGAADALKQAGADVKALQLKTPEGTSAPTPISDAACEIVVVGAGAAGMTAAIKAAEGGKQVILVEKLGLLGGGDTIRVSSYFRVGGSTLQKDLNIEDGTADAYFNTVLKESPTINQEVLRTLADESGPLADWLQGLGVPFGDVVKTDHLRLRTEDGSAPGPHFVRALSAELERLNVDVRLNTRATDIIMENGTAVGVKVNTPSGSYQIKAKAVIIAAGGFGNNQELIAKYAPELAGRPTTGSSALTGDGILMCERAGAKLLSMDLIKTNPVCYESPNGGVSLLSALPYSILVNHEGTRFTNETQPFSTGVVDEMMKQTEKMAYIVFDQTGMDDLSILRDYLSMGYFISADSAEELAELIDVDKDAFIQTVTDFQSMFDAGTDSDFGRKMVYRLDQPKFYAARVTPSIQNTAGGVAVDNVARVLSITGETIPGLYSAGHGTEHCGEGATLGAGMCTASVVFGKVSAETAIQDME